MGCCFSSSTATKDPKSHFAPASCRSPPPEPPKTPSPPAQPSPEEESVKEVLVLSEKPVTGPKQQENAQVIRPNRLELQITTEGLQAPVKSQRLQVEVEISDVSQISEVPSTSVTETFSTATTATTATAKDMKDDEVTSREGRAAGQRSPAKTVRKRAFKGEQGTGRSKRMEAPTPEKRARGRGRGSGEMRTAPHNVGSRSRSPATGRAGGVGRRAGKVAGKAGGRPMGMSAGAGAGAGESEAKSNSSADAKTDVVPEQVGSESLELECFIFL